MAHYIRMREGVHATALAFCFYLLSLGINSVATAAPDGTTADDHVITLVTAHLLPYSIRQGREPGLMVELVEEIERRLGTNRPIQFLPWPRAFRNARLSPNHIIFPLARTAEREADFDWAIEVAPLAPVFVTLNGKRLDLAQARQQHAIAVQQNSPFEQYLRQQGFTNLVVTTSAAPIPIRMLRAGRVDAWFTARDLAAYSIREQFVTEPVSYGEPVFTSSIYIALSREFPDPIRQVYRHIFDEMRQDGTYQRILKHYIHD